MRRDGQSTTSDVRRGTGLVGEVVLGIRLLDEEDAGRQRGEEGVPAELREELGQGHRD